MKRSIIEAGLQDHFLQDEHDTTCYSLVTLFSKHPELIAKHTPESLSDLITHASTVTVSVNLLKISYAHAEKSIRESPLFAEKKARFIANQQLPAAANLNRP
jgi:hypothetical protein